MSAPSTLHDSVGHRRRRRWTTLVSVAAAGALVLAACGGGDDDEEGDGDGDETTTTLAAAATTTTAAAATTTAPATTTTTLAEFEYVTEGAVVVVANASRVNGAAGRLSDRLEAVGFTMAEATNSSDAVNDLEVTQLYYAPGDAAAQAVADNLRLAFGGGAITVQEVGVPALTESGDLGEATVLVLMGNDIADKTLEEMRSPAPPADDTGDETGDDTGDGETEDGDGETEDGDGGTEDGDGETEDGDGETETGGDETGDEETEGDDGA